MNKRTKIVLITTIVIIFALIIGYFIRHSYAIDTNFLNGKKVIAIGVNDGVPGEAIKLAAESAGAEVIFSATENPLATASGGMDIQNQQRIKDLTEQYGAENIVVILGNSDGSSAALYAETVLVGDPTFAGPLAGVSLNLPVYHIVEPEIKEQVDPDVYEDQIAMMEMVLDVDDIVDEMQNVRETYYVSDIEGATASKTYANDSEIKSGNSASKDDIIKYKIEYSNGNASNSTNIRIEDTLSDGLEYVTGSSTIGEPEVTNNSDGTTKLVWTTTLEASNVDDMTYSAKVNSNEVEKVSNSAKVTIAGQIFSLNKLENIVVLKLDVTFLKEDENTGAPISGAKFRLWGTSDDGQEVDETATSTSGKVTFKNVPVGEYSLKEIEAPTGYKLDTKTYTVEAGARP